MDLCSIKWKGSYTFDSYDMMETLYTYEVESDFIALVNDYHRRIECKCSKVPSSYFVGWS